MLIVSQVQATVRDIFSQQPFSFSKEGAVPAACLAANVL